MPKTYKNATISNVGVSNTVLYTCPANTTTSIVVSMSAANIDGTNDVLIDVKFYDSSAAQYTLLGKSLPIPAGGTIVFDNIKPFLEANDHIAYTANTAGDAAVFASLLEIK